MLYIYIYIYDISSLRVNCDKGDILNAELVIRRPNEVLRTPQCSLCSALPAAYGFACPVWVTLDSIGISLEVHINYHSFIPPPPLPFPRYLDPVCTR